MEKIGQRNRLKRSYQVRLDHFQDLDLEQCLILVEFDELIPAMHQFFDELLLTVYSK
jgi:hypothetical protein